MIPTLPNSGADINDYVYIDTSVFIGNNFFDGPAIKNLYAFGEQNKIKILMPKVTYMEVLNHISSSVDDAEIGIKQFKDKSRILRNILAFRQRFEPIDIKETKSELIKIFDDLIVQSNIKILEYPQNRIEDVFEKYFTNVSPFSKKDKKNEFPDAFIIATLEAYCIQNHVKCHILALDNDIVNFKSPHFIIHDKYGDFLEKKLIRIEEDWKKLEFVVNEMKKQRDVWEKPIIEFVRQSIEDKINLQDINNKENYKTQLTYISAGFRTYSLVGRTQNEFYYLVGIYVDYSVDVIINDIETNSYESAPIKEFLRKSKNASASGTKLLIIYIF